MYITEVIKKHTLVPKMPTQADEELIFDNSYPNVQPYLFKISHTTSMPSSPSIGTAVQNKKKQNLKGKPTKAVYQEHFYPGQRY